VTTHLPRKRHKRRRIAAQYEIPPYKPAKDRPEDALVVPCAACGSAIDPTRGYARSIDWDPICDNCSGSPEKEDSA